jgi:hypothetical protein
MAFVKPNKLPTETSSYRPIALTSCAGKVLEKIINVRLIRYLEARNLLSPVQFGFRPLRGTTDALLRLQNHISKYRTQGKHTICIFFDMRKAYDTTWRYGILKRLFEVGVRGNLADYLREFLRRRLFRVKTGNHFSPLMTQNEGVPQGSVISCTLFLQAIDTISEVLPPNVSSSLYVDDYMIYASSGYLPALARRMQDAVNRLDNWTNERGFSFSSEKTMALHVQPARSHECAPDLFLHGRPISFSPTVTFLGMLFDNKLSWKPHLDSLKGKCIRGLNLLKCLSKLSWGQIG